MASDRMQRRIERLLDLANEAIEKFDWEAVRNGAEAVLALDPGNVDGLALLAAVQRAQDGSGSSTPSQITPTSFTAPTSFANCRYEVKRFLGEGGKKKVYLAQDTLLDREVAFALIKTEGLYEVSRTRITREAQAMGRLGSHPHIVTVFDLGQESDQPYMVTELMVGGDVEGIIEDAGGMPKRRRELITTFSNSQSGMLRDKCSLPALENHGNPGPKLRRQRWSTELKYSSTPSSPMFTSGKRT